MFSLVLVWCGVLLLLLKTLLDVFLCEGEEPCLVEGWHHTRH